MKEQTWWAVVRRGVVSGFVRRKGEFHLWPDERLVRVKVTPLPEKKKRRRPTEKGASQ